MSNNSIKRMEYYPFLDGMRTLAIAWIFLNHLNYLFRLATGFIQPFSRWIDHFSQIGTFGVDMFFVISGFLISGLLFEDLDSRVRIKRFYVRRAFKILPQYILIVLVGIVSVCFTKIPEGMLVSSLSYFLMFQNFAHSLFPLEHLWSIAVEEHFYFIYPLLALLFGCLIKLAEPWIRKNLKEKMRWTGGLFLMLSAAMFAVCYFRFNPYASWFYLLPFLASGALLVAALIGFKPLNFILENVVLREVGKCSDRNFGI